MIPGRTEREREKEGKERKEEGGERPVDEVDFLGKLVRREGASGLFV